jgi:hypothetical protein
VSHHDEFTAICDELTGHRGKQNDSIVRTAIAMVEYDVGVMSVVVRV